jgi:hypothetical protein
MLFGRTTYELMEAHWPAVARDEDAPRSDRDWARRLAHSIHARAEELPAHRQGTPRAPA